MHIVVRTVTKLAHDYTYMRIRTCLCICKHVLVAMLCFLASPSSEKYQYAWRRHGNVD